MIKYFTYDSFDEYGQHIFPINSSSELSKTAAMNYASEISKVIDSMIRKPNLYYVVINALGSYEVWGVNGNGDAFPSEALSHLSLRSDLGTPNDYGYKTFEYYAKLFKHHVNKPDSPSFGEVIFSHWNPVMQRVELIVGIDRVSGSDMVEAIESGGNVAVSMGAKVPFDVCSICGNQAKTRASYCDHAKNYLGKIIDEATAAKWSRQLGKKILPGTKVHVINTKPKFFDISKVYIGADRTAFVLGKAASQGITMYSTDHAEVLGITDEYIDKLSAIGKSAILGKNSEMDKEVGSLGPDDIDGQMARISRIKALSKAIKERSASSIEEEPDLGNSYLDTIASKFPIGQSVNSMLNVGVFPKPREFQRMVLVRAGHGNLADILDSRNTVFDHENNDDEIPFTGDYGSSDTISSSLSGILNQRSFLPGFLSGRVIHVNAVIKVASQDVETTKCLGIIAAMYNGVKKYAYNLTSKRIAEGIEKTSCLKTSIESQNYVRLINAMNKQASLCAIANNPASEFETLLINSGFSGKMNYIEKDASHMLDSISLPGAYISSAIKQKSISSKEDYIVNDWMSKQADLSNFMYRAEHDVNSILFNK